MAISKDFKTIDKRVINVSIIDKDITFKNGVFEAKYSYNNLETIIHMHNKIMDEKTLNEMRSFINKYCEHIQTVEGNGQLGLF